MEESLVLVRIRVFSVFMIAPRGSAMCLNLSKNGSTSSSASKALQSSTYARMIPSVPISSSPDSPCSFLCEACLVKKNWSSRIMSSRTRPAKTGEKGQP